MLRSCLFLFSILMTAMAHAAEEVESWQCQGAGSIGFLWENGAWLNQAFEPVNYLFTLSPAGNGSLIFSGYQWRFDGCSRSDVVRCTSAAGNSIIFSPTTGQGAVASTVATALPPSNQSAIAFMERVACSAI